MTREKKLTRSKEDRMVAGVAGGLGNYLGLDPTLVRLGYLLLTILSGGIGIPVYVALWLIIPDQREGIIDSAADALGDVADETRRLGSDVRDSVQDAIGRATQVEEADPARESVYDRDTRGRVERAIDRATNEDS